MDSSEDKMNLSGSFLNLGKKMAESSSSSCDNNIPFVIGENGGGNDIVTEQPKPLDKENSSSNIPGSDLGKKADPMSSKSMKMENREASTSADADNDDVDVDALANNKVGVEIEPDVKSNSVNINMCSFVFTFSCFPWKTAKIE